ncbi:MAG: hypothetical protein HUU08_03010 [Candidatus Brocadia sp.]|nr:hypothetical protein [Candidatus Brocadia sp.]
MFAQYFNIGFITYANRVDRSFMDEIEAMARESGSFGVVEDCLIRDREVKNGFEDRSGFPCSDGKGDVKGQDKTEGIVRVVDFREVYFGLLW